MKFPFVLRSQHDELVEALRQQLAEQQQELHRLKDWVFEKTFGIQLHDSLPRLEEQTSAPAEPLTEEEVRDRQKEADQRELATIRRLRPSQLGPALEKRMVKRVHDMALAARPPITPGATVHPAQQVFDKAKQEALAN